MTERKNITDKEIIELYKAGWSINDIVINCKTSIRRVRSILQREGIDTSKYRKASDQLKEIILMLVSTGISYRRIADTIDISVHLIRQVLRDNKVNSFDLISSSEGKVLTSDISDFDWNIFYKLYESGSLGFMKCAQKCDFSVADCKEAVMRLSDNNVDQHREKLQAFIALQKETGLSAASVSKQLGVSTAIVKKVFNQEN